MKRKVLKTIEYILFAALVIGAVAILYNVLSWKDTNGNYMSTTKQLYETDDNLIDVVFMGSSHCYCGIYPAVLWEDAGIAAFDMSTSGQDRNSTYHMLAELLKTQSPKVVYVDLFELTYDRHDIVSNEYRNYLAMKTSKNSIKSVDDYFEGDEYKQTRQNYYFRFPIVHTRYKELTKNDFEDYGPGVFGRGAEYLWKVGDAYADDSLNDLRDGVELPENAKAWIDDLISLSEENGFTLEFIVIPFGRDSEKQKIINAGIAYANSKGIRCNDFNKDVDRIGLNYETDFIDNTHLNAYGAEKFTRYIEQTLLCDYNLKDFRGDDRYAFWEEDAKYYEHLYTLNKMESTDKTGDLVQYIKDNPNICTVLSLEGNFVTDTDLIDSLKELGMTEDEYVSGGKWVYDNSQLIKLVSNNPGETGYYDLSDDLTVKVTFDEMFSRSNIVLSGEEYGFTGGFLTVLAYDKIQDKVVMHKGYYE